MQSRTTATGRTTTSVWQHNPAGPDGTDNVGGPPYSAAYTIKQYRHFEELHKKGVARALGVGHMGGPAGVALTQQICAPRGVRTRRRGHRACILPLLAPLVCPSVAWRAAVRSHHTRLAEWAARPSRGGRRGSGDQARHQPAVGVARLIQVPTCLPSNRGPPHRHCSAASPPTPKAPELEWDPDPILSLHSATYCYMLEWDPDTILSTCGRPDEHAALASLGIHYLTFSIFGNIWPPKYDVDDPVFTAIAAKYGKSTRQVIMRWAVEHQMGIVTSTTNMAHARADMDIFDFRLTDAEVAAIDAFQAQGPPGQAPTFT